MTSFTLFTFMFLKPPFKVISNAHISLARNGTFKDINKDHEIPPIKNPPKRVYMVETAGVEPASEIKLPETSTYVVRLLGFPLFASGAQDAKTVACYDFTGNRQAGLPAIPSESTPLSGRTETTGRNGPLIRQPVHNYCLHLLMFQPFLTG